MSVSFAIAASARAVDVAAPGAAQTLLGITELISTSARNVRCNREFSRSLARRMDALVAAVAQQDDPLSVAAGCVLEGLLLETRDLLRRQEGRSYLVQVLHRERDLRDLQDLDARIDLELAAFNVNSRVRAALMVEGSVASSRTLADSLDALESTPAPSPSAYFPAPQYCFGREQETQAAAQLLAAGGHVSIIGAPGMGKTTLARVVLHDPAVVGRFGRRRFFVACHAVSGQISCLGTVAAAVGIVPSAAADHADIKKRLQAALRTSPALIVLDNFESVWEASECRSDAEEILRFLSGIECVSILLTLRGSEHPGGVPWSRPFLPVLSPLASEAALQLVTMISGIDAPGQHHMALIDAQENLPLALVLLANLAQYEPPEALLARWNDQRTAILRRGDCGSLDAAIETSLNSPRMQSAPDAMRLLGLLSLLPCGALEEDITLWCLEDSRNQLSALLRNALAYRTDSQRIRVLAPIRNYILSYHPPCDSDVVTLCAHYFQLADHISQASHRTLAGEIASVTNAEADNIACIIRYALQNDINAADALCATRALCTLFIGTGVGAGPDLLPEALRVARKMHWAKHEADLLCKWAKIAFVTHRQGSPASLLRDARALYQQIGDTDGVFDTSVELIDFLTPPDAVVESLALRVDAVSLGDFKRLATCCLMLGRAYAGSGNGTAAISSFEEAIELLSSQPNVDHRSVAFILQWLADVYLGIGDFATGIKLLGESFATSQRAGDVKGTGITHSILGWVYSDQGHFSKAIEHYRLAVAAFSPVDHRNTANCHLYLARAFLAVGDEATALSSVHAAEKYLLDEGDTPTRHVHVLRAYAELALARGDLSEARIALSTARNACRTTDDQAPPGYLIIAESEILELTVGLEKRSGGRNEEAQTAAIVAASIHLSFNCSPAVVRCLAALSELVDDEAATTIIDAILPPLHRFGFSRTLSKVLMLGAGIAERQGNRSVALSRANKALHYARQTKNGTEIGDVLAYLDSLE